TRNAASRKNRPGPKGCATNVAMRRCGTWQGSDHCLRPAPCLATFVAATRSATKREQTLSAALCSDKPGLAAKPCKGESDDDTRRRNHRLRRPTQKRPGDACLRFE